MLWVNMLWLFATLTVLGLAIMLYIGALKAYRSVERKVQSMIDRSFL